MAGIEKGKVCYIIGQVQRVFRHENAVLASVRVVMVAALYRAQ